MSSIVSKASRDVPDGSRWLADLLGTDLPIEGKSIVVNGTKLTMVDGILRAASAISSTQQQTGDAFGFKWAKRDSFEGEFLGQARQRRIGPLLV